MSKTTVIMYYFGGFCKGKIGNIGWILFEKLF